MKTFLTLLLFASLSFAQTVTNGAPSLPAPTNDGTTGTQLNHTATVNVAGNAILATTSETTVPVFIVTAHAGTSGNPGFATSGIAQCFMDANESGSAMPYVVNSVITGGDCHAQSTTPSAGVYVLGFLYDSTTSTGVKANVIVAPFIYGGGGGSCGTGTAGDLMEFTGSGATCGNAPIVDGGSAGLTVNVPSTGVFNANLGSGNAQLLLGPISDQSSYMGSFSYVDVSNTGNAFFLTNGPLAEIQGIGSADIGQLFIHGYNSLTAGTPTWYIKDTLGNLVEGVPSGSVGAPAGVIIGAPSGIRSPSRSMLRTLLTSTQPENCLPNRRRRLRLASTFHQEQRQQVP